MANPTSDTVTGSGTTYDVAISGMTGNGSVTVSVNAGAAQDAAGNVNLASTSTDNTVAFSSGPPTLSINNPSILEGNSGVQNLAFTVTRGGDLTSALTVYYATADGTATTANDDYLAQSGSVSFILGATMATFNVPIVGDTTPEPDETFSVNLTEHIAATTPAFAPMNSVVVGTIPSRGAVGDFNRDGKPDLVYPTTQNSSVSVLLNTTPAGASTATFAGRSTFAVGSNPQSAAAADFDGDGKPDLVVANAAQSSVSVLLNTTPAASSVVSFAPQVTFAVGSNPRWVAVGDFNGDGKPDLAVTNASSNNISVLLNTTAMGATIPTFTIQQTFAAGLYASFVAVGDLNGDGTPDLAVVNQNGNSVSLLLNTTATGAASATFLGQVPFSVGQSPRSLSLGDLNGDGKPDLAVVNVGVGSSAVSVLLNTTAAGSATPTFATAKTVAGTMSATAAAEGDFNGDGIPDLSNT